MRTVPVLFLDADDTIRKGYGTTGAFVNTPDAVDLFDDVAVGIYRWLYAGYAINWYDDIPEKGPSAVIAIVSNQAGVEKGHVDLDMAKQVSGETASQLYDVVKEEVAKHGQLDGFKIDVFHSFAPQDRHPVRKPASGLAAVIADRMLLAWDIAPDWDKCHMVGDREDDSGFATNVGIGFSWAHDFFKREKVTA